MSHSRQNVLGYPVDQIDRKQATDLIEEAWATGSSMHVVTLNAEMIIAAQSDKRLDTAIRQADLVIADGAGVVLALQLNARHASRVPGIELAQISLARAAEKDIPVALIGSNTETLNILYRTLPEKYPGLKLVSSHDGYFELEKEASIIEQVRQSGAQLVLVAMGVPKQDYFIQNACKQIKSVFIGVGGSFDIWSGTKRRAPAIFQNCHLEWLYRLINEPWRYKRMGQALPKFAWQVIVDFLKNKTGN